jgi:uncharacterized membrane protein YbhN (UPF0104 family)
MRRLRRRFVFAVAGTAAALYLGALILALTRLELPPFGALAGLAIAVAAVAQISGKWMFGMLFRHGVRQAQGALSKVAAFRAALVGAGVARLIPAGGAITPVAMAWVVRREAPGSGGAAVRSTVLNYAGLLVGTGICLLWVLDRGLHTSLQAGTLIVALITLATGLLLMFGTGWLGSIASRLPGRLRRALGHTALNHPPGWHSQGWLWGRLAAEATALWLVMEAFGIHLTPTQTFAVFGISQLAGGLPGTPGGIGFTEAGLVGALAAFGFPAEQTVAPTLVFRLVSYWLPALAGLVAGGSAFLKAETEG